MSAQPLVTLIVPTVHHRVALFARALRYLDASGFRGPVLVSDHSPKERASVIAEATRPHPGLDLKLLQHDPELHFLERLSACAAAAETPYVHLHADDDFVVPVTLDRLVAEMQASPSCVAAMGLQVHVFLEQGQAKMLAKHAVPHADPFERMLAQLESFSSVLYALRRREEMVSTFGFTVARCPDVQFWQYLESCVAALRGPVAVLPALHYVRSVHPQKWSATLVRERSPDHFPYLILSPELQPRLAAFRAALAEACAGANVEVDAGRLEVGLIYLLHRGLKAMGLPPPSVPSPSDAALQALEARLMSPRNPAGAELQRIFAFARG